MRCLGCDYSLDHLDQTRCPECGREFDLGVPATFRQDDDLYPLSYRSAGIAVAVAVYGPAFLIFALEGLWEDILSVLTPAGLFQAPFDDIIAIPGTVAIVVVGALLARRNAEACLLICMVLMVVSFVMALWTAAWSHG